MKGIPLSTADTVTSPSNGETHFPGKRLSYTEATGSKLYATPPLAHPKQSQAECRSVTINNPAYGDINPDDNLV